MTSELSPLRLAKHVAIAGLATLAPTQGSIPTVSRFEQDRSLGFYGRGFDYSELPASGSRNEAGIKPPNKLGVQTRSNDFDRRLAPPDWTSACWAEVGGYASDGPGYFALDFFKGRNISYIDMAEAKNGTYMANFGNLQVRSENDIYTARIYVGDTELSDGMVKTDTVIKGNWGMRTAYVGLPESQAKRRFSYTLKEGFGIDSYQSYGTMDANGANFYESYVTTFYTPGLHATGGCSEKKSPRPLSNQYVLPASAPLWKSIMWNDDGGHVTNHDSADTGPYRKNYRRAGHLRSHAMSNETSGCYIACYSHQQGLAQNSTYAINQRVSVVGQLRTSGVYVEGTCLPTGFLPEQDLSASKDFTEACKNYFPECDPCWPGGDTGGWLALYGRWVK